MFDCCVKECDGRCCAAFYFPSSPVEIAAKMEAHGVYNGGDGWMIADMLVPLSADEVKERAERFGLNPDILMQNGDHMFTCQHWDETTRECGVYEHRPTMCATYPYGKDCGHCGGGKGCSVEQPYGSNIVLGIN